MSNQIWQLPPYAKPDMIIDAIPADERVWVPQAPNIWFRPLLLDTVGGQWFNLLRVRRSGVLSRHRHPAPVYGYVIKGHWHYLEHDFVASPGKFLFEPPGETHTLVVDSDAVRLLELTRARRLPVAHHLHDVTVPVGNARPYTP